VALRRNLILALAAALVTGACVGAAAEHERLADRAYAERRYAEALVEYRLALVNRTPNAALRAKAGAAALHAGELAVAAEEYVALGQEGGEDRRGEAADGLVRVASAAIRRGDQQSLAAALEGLQQAAPGRAVGRFASELAGSVTPQTPEELAILVHAAAAAPDARMLDSLMYAYGVALRRLGRCEEATTVYESLLRRQRAPAVTRGARDGVVLCALQLGRRALDRGQPTVAEEWYSLAATRGGESPGGRVAYVGLGDVRFALGDLLGAMEAYEQARAGLFPGDSIYAIVRQRLNLISEADFVR
jgi:tetratricopeptide (TPR) repeat protein